MHQLTSLDTQILRLEDGRNHGHVSVLVVCAGHLDAATLRTLVAERIHLLPPLRRRLAEVPFGLDYPYWVDADGLDLDYHVRELSLPAPGDDAELTEQAARIVSVPLDRSRPLWELYVIGGLAGGRTGVLLKLHHAAVDGMAAANVLSVLFDAEPPAGTYAGESMPRRLGLLTRGLTKLPLQPWRSARTLPRILPHLGSIPVVPRVGAVAPTPVNQPISAHRRIALSRQSLDEVKRIKAHYGVTVNDVVVAACAGALRSWLLDRGVLPDRPLVAMVPVSVRSEGSFGNASSAMLVEIPTDEPDPEQRLLQAHATLSEAKERHRALPAGLFQRAADVVPPALLERVSRAGTLATTRLPLDLPVNTCISNVPGARTPQYLAGARVEATFPLSMITDGVGLNITLLSYCDELDFGIVVDRELVGDPSPLAQALKAAQAELLALCDGDSQTPSDRPAATRADHGPELTVPA